MRSWLLCVSVLVLSGRCRASCGTCIHGNCTVPTNVSNSTVCACNNGWSGATCNSPVCAASAECPTMNGCCNGGTCTVSGTCNCAANWQGTDCSGHLCSPTCLNNGTCAANNTCHCIPAWSGATCATDVNECLQPAPACISRADCVNSAGSYACNCRADYTGNGSVCFPRVNVTMKTFGVANDSTGISSVSIEDLEVDLAWALGLAGFTVMQNYTSDNKTQTTNYIRVIQTTLSVGAAVYAHISLNNAPLHAPLEMALALQAQVKARAAAASAAQTDGVVTIGPRGVFFDSLYGVEIHHVIRNGSTCTNAGDSSWNCPPDACANCASCECVADVATCKGCNQEPLWPTGAVCYSQQDLDCVKRACKSNKDCTSTGTLTAFCGTQKICEDGTIRTADSTSNGNTPSSVAGRLLPFFMAMMLVLAL